MYNLGGNLTCYFQKPLGVRFDHGAESEGGTAVEQPDDDVQRERQIRVEADSERADHGDRSAAS